MPLPIPDIMEKASAVLRLANEFANADITYKHGEMVSLAPLREALKKISPDDLLAVLNEVGSVYAGLHNMRIAQIGSRPNAQMKTVEVAINVDFGLGPRAVVIPLTPEGAEQVARGINESVAALKMENGKLITSVDNFGQSNG